MRFITSLALILCPLAFASAQTSPPDRAALLTAVDAEVARMNALSEAIPALSKQDAIAREKILSRRLVSLIAESNEIVTTTGPQNSQEHKTQIARLKSIGEEAQAVIEMALIIPSKVTGLESAHSGDSSIKMPRFVFFAFAITAGLFTYTVGPQSLLTGDQVLAVDLTAVITTIASGLYAIALADRGVPRVRVRIPKLTRAFKRANLTVSPQDEILNAFIEPLEELPKEYLLPALTSPEQKKREQWLNLVLAELQRRSSCAHLLESDSPAVSESLQKFLPAAK